MATNNPNQTTSSQPTPKAATDAGAGRIEQSGRRIESGIDKAEKGAEQLASNAIDRVRQAREQASNGISQQRDQIAHRIHKVGTLLRSGAQTLAEDDPIAHSVISYVGDRAEGLARYVQDATPSTVADDLHSFAKRRPGVFFGGAFLIGLTVGRFIKSSTPEMGSRRAGAQGYGEPDYSRDDDQGSVASQRARPATEKSSSQAAPSQAAPSQAAPSSGYVAPSSGTSLPYVSAGSGIGSTPSSASYGASTSTGTKPASESASPSYGTASVGGTGGYAPSGASSGPTGTRPSQSSGLKESPEDPAKPRAHAVREGEGSKS